MTDINENEKPLWWYSGTDGPDSWHKFCSIGESQSPVDIVSPISKELSEISFSYVEEPLSLFIAKHTVKASPFRHSFVTIDNVKYELEEIHFHSPSEHLVDSRAYPLEAHLVHTGEDGGHMILGLFIVEGNAGKDFNPLIESFEQFRLTNKYDESLLIDPFDFIPSDPAYYSYSGSYTSPPCIEGVNWLIFRDPFQLPGAQIERLRRVVGENCRPVQPLNGRVIEASF